MKFQIETERMQLRVLDERAAQQVLTFYLENKKEFEAWELERHQNFYHLEYQKKMLHAEFGEIARGHMLRYYACLKESTDCVVGTVSIGNISRMGFERGDLGYKIHHAYWRKGYGEEMVRAVLNSWFGENKMHRLEAMVHPENKPSQLMLEKIGFQQEGLARQVVKLQGNWCDMYRYGCLKNDIIPQGMHK